MRSSLIALTVATLAASPAYAQEASPAEDDAILANGAQIVVIGRGLAETPAAPAYDTVTIERETLTASASGRLEDALSNVAGFQQFRRSDSRSSNPSAQGATLRALGGNASSRALVLLDGVPMVDPFFGYIPFSAIDPGRLAQARVTRGGGSGPFGAGALAGTIELESAGPESIGLFSGSAMINDREETELSATLAPELGDGFAVLTGRWDRGQGFWTTPEAERVDASVRAKYESWSLGGRVVQQLGEDVELQLRGLAFEDNRTLRFAGADNSIEGQDVSLRVVGRGDWAFDALAYGQWRNFTNVVISSTRFVPVLDQKDTPATGFGGKFELRPPVGEDHVLRLGADYRRSAGDLAEDRYSAFSGAFTGNRLAGGRNSDLGLFVEDDWILGPVTLTGGLRADRWTISDGYMQNFDGSGAVLEDNAYADRSGWDLSWRAGLLAGDAEGVQFRAAAYSGLRLPTLNELYRPFVVFPVTTNANAQLENERLVGFEAGLDLQAAEGVRFSLTAFHNRVDNAIANVTLDATTRERQNLDAINANGIELGSQIELGQVSFSGSLAYTDATIVGTGASLALDGNRPPQTPRWSGSATLGWEPMKDLRLAATLRHVGAQFEDDQETDILPAATTLDLFAQVPVTDGLSFVLRGENLFDEEVITRNQGGSMDIGAPRTVWAGLRFGY